ncbi:hypothetical protein ACFQ4C_22800 [Larkinella insperata]|uniref:Outer membrane protein beta-barrel domain-containing protein n=1 Tax=Larkinella insperata TaxID=332158 RepID=A0ABW3Q985_9BACT|nr:hypothetical protein [Larkinella insperata]
MASLQELPDDELDKLFRSSAEEFEPPYNPDDWSSLRRRLDDDDRLRFLDRFIYWGLPLLLLLLTTTSLLMSPNDGQSAGRTVSQQPATVLAEESGQPAAPRSNSPTGSVPTDEKPSEPPSSQTDRSESASTETNTPTVLNGASGPADAGSETRTRDKLPQPNDPVARRMAKSAPGAAPRLAQRSNPSGNNLKTSSANERVAADPVTKNRLVTSETLKGNSAGRTVSNRPGRRRAKPADQPLSGNTGAGLVGSASNRLNPSRSRSQGQLVTADNRAGTGSISDIDRSRNSNSSSETVPFDVLSKLSYIPARTPQQPALPALPEPDLEPMRPPVVPRIVPPPAVPVVGYPALSIRVVAAPDLNFVGKSRQGARDFQVGVLAEYRFLRRFTIQGGILRSVKTYRAAASDYTRPDHWYGPLYESVDAVCTVLDIPVNLRFDFLLNSRRRWFISSGFSSYIMQEEHYKYNYPYGVNPTQQKYKEWYGKTGFHEWSHLNFSFGYERNFRSDGPLRRLSWQVEPFLKDPRRSTLGYGKIRLMSTGVFFSLRYRL